MPPKETKKENNDGPTMEGLQEQMNELNSSLKKLPAEIGKAFTTSVGQLTKAQRTKENGTPTPTSADKGEKKEKKMPTTQDLERMSRSEFMEHMMNLFEERVVKPVNERVDQYETKSTKKEIENEVKQIEKDNPGVLPIVKDTMRRYLEEDPSMSISNAFRLSKMDHSDDLEKFAKEQGKNEKKSSKEKAAKEESDDDEGDDDDEGERNFTGLFPTNGSRSRGESEEGEDTRTRAQILDDNFNETFKGLDLGNPA